MNTSSTSAAKQINGAIAARHPVIYVVTWEEERLEKMLRAASKTVFKDDRPVWQWSAAQGFTTGPAAELDLKNPVDAMTYLSKQAVDALVLMKDLPAEFDRHPDLIRAVRDAYDSLSSRPGTIIFSYPQTAMPPMLSREVYLLRLPLPEADEIRAYLQIFVNEQPKDQQPSDEWLEQISNAMKGLSTNEARDLYRHLISESMLDIQQAMEGVREAKAHMLMKENCLEVIPEHTSIDQIGGLVRLKKWMLNRRKLFTKEAREANIKPPSGILIMGVSGCGKSLAAKTIPSVWGLPLIRLDMNLIMSGGWGTPEVAWERALRAIENAAPVVLWIDEFENSFGFLHDTSTSGNMTIFSSFLTWMQEKPDNVFVAATANRIEILPPEMVRKGRFDQLFFLDLPLNPAREEIIKIHIRNQQRDPDEFDIKSIADFVDGWTAAEIEQMIKSAQIDAFTAGREFNYDDIVRSIYSIVPLSKTMSKEFAALRIWARDRAAKAD